MAGRRERLQVTDIGDEFSRRLTVDHRRGVAKDDLREDSEKSDRERFADDGLIVRLGCGAEQVSASAGL